MSAQNSAGIQTLLDAEREASKIPENSAPNESARPATRPRRKSQSTGPRRKMSFKSLGP
ncbi:hypothetical protein E4U55_001762, partial [Claviceps digitariae]